MANCHPLFQGYKTEISISSGKRTRMKDSKDKLRNRIRKYFKDKHSDYEPKFYIQGSDKMNIAIRTKEDICDLDDGVYFFREPDVTATTLQSWIRDAVDGYTETAPEHRKKCVRTIFAGDYEIDMPVYYKVDGENYKLAVKNNGWEESDPKAMIVWFNSKKDENGQLVRIVKFLKGWCDNKPNKMPNGLSIAILSANAKKAITLDERDDVAVVQILKQIRTDLGFKFQCIVPVTPYDDLFCNFDQDRTNYFLTALNDFISDADKAIEEESQEKASKLWQKHLGNRFPDGKDEQKANSARKDINALKRIAVISEPWASL